MPVLDQATVFTEFTSAIPADISAPLRPHIAGPHAQLRRYTAAAEKSLGSLGAYNPNADQTYNWPNKDAAAIVDLDFVRVFIDDAKLQYFQDLKGSGDTIAPVGSYKNRISTNNVRGWKTNTSTYPRLASLKDRDVKVGDVVHLQDGSNELWTSVADLIGDPVSSSIAAATADAANAVARPNSKPGNAPTISVTGGGSTGGLLAAGTYFVRYSFYGPFGETWASAAGTFTSASGNIPRVTIPALPTGATAAKIYLSPVGGTALQCTLYATAVAPTTYDLATAYATGGAAYPADVTQTSGTVNGVTQTAIDASTYEGSATGDLTETYTIIVTQASTGGDLTTAKFQVVSASGRDDVASVTPSASGVATAIGTRNLTITWTRSANDFVIGQTWQTTVGQAFTPPTATSAGTYTGSTDVTYIVTVTRGGTYAGSTKPQVSVTAADGTDSSGPTNVTASAGAVSIGTRGVTLAWNQTTLRKGDIYYVVVTGPTAGAYRTIVLQNNLTTALLASTDMDITLFIKKNIEVTEQRVDAPPAVNWVASANNLIMKSGVTAFDASLTDGGIAFSVPVKGGNVYAHYRAWLSTYAGKLTTVSTTDEADTLFGADNTATADNPLAYAVWKAALNSNGQEVQFTAIHDPTDLTEWENCLAILEGLPNVANIVPLTRLSTVCDAYRAHVTARADDPERSGEWRCAWFNLAAQESIVVVDATKTSDLAVAMATLTDNPDVTGTQYTLLTCTTGNAKFVTNGVLAGDVVRYLYSIDAFGTPTYQDFIVESVVNEDTLIVEIGPGSAVSTGQRVEVWRDLSKTQIAHDLGSTVTGGLVNKRYRYLWPDKATDDLGNEVDGYHVCAAYAGMVGGIAPHQGLRNLQVKGFASTPRSTQFFNNAQLNILGAAGFFVVTTSNDGLVYALFARTPDDTSVATREEATVRLDDAIRYLFFNAVAGFFGVANTSDSALALISSEIKSAAQHGISDTKVERIGPMIQAADMDTPRRHLTQLDKIVVSGTITRGFPINDASFVLVLQ